MNTNLYTKLSTIAGEGSIDGNPSAPGVCVKRACVPTGVHGLHGGGAKSLSLTVWSGVGGVWRAGVFSLPRAWVALPMAPPP